MHHVTAMMPLASIASTPQTAVLDVRNMTCELCSVTVKKSLEKVPGVSRARIDFAAKTAIVTFDANKNGSVDCPPAQMQRGCSSCSA